MNGKIQNYKFIDSYDQGAGLADDIIQHRRRRPIIVITEALWLGAPLIDPSQMADTVGSGVDVAFISELGATGFNDKTRPCKMGVWNGNVRAWRGGEHKLWTKPSRADMEEIAAYVSWNKPIPHAETDWKARATQLERRLSDLKKDMTIAEETDYVGLFKPDDIRLYDLLIRIDWAERIPVGEKDRRPLPEYWGYDKDFLPLPPMVDPRLLAKTMMEALTGLDAENKSRHLHMFACGENAEQRLGEWGNPIWRSRISTTSGAPTLLYTRDFDNNIVFLHAGHHDDWLVRSKRKEN